MIDLSNLDCLMRCPPEYEHVLHVHLSNPREPQTGLCDALEALAGPNYQRYQRVAWPGLEPRALEEALARAASKSTLVFMQLQTPGVVSGALIDRLRELADPHCVFVSWCGDVGRNPAWSHELAPRMDAMLFSSLTQAKEHRAAGFPNAGYLQIGYDTDIHYEGSEVRSGVAFMGQNLSDNQWPGLPGHEAQLRRDVVAALWDAFDDTFACYGWGSPHHPFLARELSAERYRRAQIAVSISLTSKLERYTSDRLFRALACGPAVLVKRFEGCEMLGLSHGENCLLFDTPDQCVEQARVLLDLPQTAREIGAAGAKLARDQHTWGMRMRELAPYLEYIRGKRA